MNLNLSFQPLQALRFGSGWAWLCASPNGELDICSTANQDNPLNARNVRGNSNIGH